MKLYQAVENEDKGVFPCPLIEDKEIFGYKETNCFFVDSSGFGSENESALTVNQFSKQVKKGFYYAVVEQGKFQVYIGEFIKNTKTKKEQLKDLGYISRKKVANNTYEYIKENNQRIIKLHQTDILTFTVNNTVILTSNGWKTNTTKERLNRFLPSNISVYQKNKKWYIVKDNETIDFEDNMEINL